VTLTAGAFLRAFYWRLRSRRRDAAHMLGVLSGFAASAVRLPVRLRRAGARRPRLAIVLLERMGDIVAAEPVARLARRRHPDAWICWIAQPPYAALPHSYPEVDDVLAVRCLTEWMLLERLRLFDVVWNLHANGTDCPHCCIPRADPQVVPTRHDYYEHGGLLTVHCLSAGLPRLDEGPALTPSPAATATVDALALPPRFVVIHATSTDAGREWAAEKWRELVARILAADPAVAIAEVGVQSVAIRTDGPRQRTLCGRLSVPETAEVIRRAELFIGIDSGPAHLANAVATPGVILLGRYLNFRRYNPFSGDYANGRRATMLHAEGPAAMLPVDEVFAAATVRLSAAQPVRPSDRRSTSMVGI
jgi:heptosyltransferase III